MKNLVKNLACVSNMANEAMDLEDAEDFDLGGVLEILARGQSNHPTVDQEKLPLSSNETIHQPRVRMENSALLGHISGYDYAEVKEAEFDYFPIYSDKKIEVPTLGFLSRSEIIKNEPNSLLLMNTGDISLTGIASALARAYRNDVNFSDFLEYPLYFTNTNTTTGVFPFFSLPVGWNLYLELLTIKEEPGESNVVKVTNNFLQLFQERKVIYHDFLLSFCPRQYLAFLKSFVYAYDLYEGHYALFKEKTKQISVSQQLLEYYLISTSQVYKVNLRMEGLIGKQEFNTELPEGLTLSVLNELDRRNRTPMHMLHRKLSYEYPSITRSQIIKEVTTRLSEYTYYNGEIYKVTTGTSGFDEYPVKSSYSFCPVPEEKLEGVFGNEFMSTPAFIGDDGKYYSKTFIWGLMFVGVASTPGKAVSRSMELAYHEARSKIILNDLAFQAHRIQSQGFLSLQDFVSKMSQSFAPKHLETHLQSLVRQIDYPFPESIQVETGFISRFIFEYWSDDIPASCYVRQNAPPFFGGKRLIPYCG